MDLNTNVRSVDLVYAAAIDKFKASAIRRDSYTQKGGGVQFPVHDRQGVIQDSLSLSDTLRQVPTFAVDYVFVEPGVRHEAEQWLRQEKANIIRADITPQERSNDGIPTQLFRALGLVAKYRL